MKGKEYPGRWIKHKNIFAFPYNWQTPAQTELWAYEECLKSKVINTYEQIFCFPWATLVDSLKHGQQRKAKFFIKALNTAPPKMALKRITYCQHIYALDLLPYFKMLGITDIFWSHKVKGEDEIDGIKLHPFPLFPVMSYRRPELKKNKPLLDRKYLYSFIGAYQPELYLTEARKWIFQLPKIDNALVLERTEWHFESDVYREQLLGITESEAKSHILKRHEEEYIKTMDETVFCLCPSGSGPNSIRLWEALKFGCIPVLISDTLELYPITNQMGNIIVQAAETKQSIDNLPNTLQGLLNDKPYILDCEKTLKKLNVDFK